MAFNKGFGNSVISLPHETVLWTWGGGSVVDIWGSQQCSLMMTLLFLLVVFFFPLLCRVFFLIFFHITKIFNFSPSFIH